jgi:preprotein translocase subunit SecD
MRCAPITSAGWVVLLFVVSGCGGGGHSTTSAQQQLTDKGGVRLLYRVDTPGASSASIDQALSIVRQRVAKTAVVQREGANAIAVDVPGNSPGAPGAIAARPGRLAFYDWKPTCWAPTSSPTPAMPT